MAYDIVWATSASHEYIAYLRALAQSNANDARTTASMVQHDIKHLAINPSGTPGRVTGTYERSIPHAHVTLIFTFNEKEIQIVAVTPTV